MSTIKAVKGSEASNVTVQTRHAAATVKVHTLWVDGTVSEKTMSLPDALEFQARFLTDTKAITIWATQ